MRLEVPSSDRHGSSAIAVGILRDSKKKGARPLRTVMWSPAYNSAWGCRCCSETGTMADHTNTNWQIYALQRGASTEAPTRMPSAVPIPTRLPTELPTEEPNTILPTASPKLSPTQADCKTPGTPYQGELAVTNTGTKCQSWDNRDGYDYMNG